MGYFITNISAGDLGFNGETIPPFGQSKIPVPDITQKMQDLKVAGLITISGSAATTGAFTLDVVISGGATLKSLAVNQFLEVLHDGTTWVAVGTGAVT